MSNSECVYARVEVGGIQNYICSAGKLKEMIGGSEIIRRLAGDFHRENVVAPLGLREVKEPGDGRDWFILVQEGAGIVRLILPDKERGRDYLAKFSGEVLGHFPGLPLYGAAASMRWEDKESMRAAVSEVEEKIGAQRSRYPVAAGAPMLPVLKSCRLDGMPVYKENESLPCFCRSQDEILVLSRERLRGYLTPPDGISPKWSDNLDEMLGRDYSRAALIRMDGNGLGKRFAAWREKSSALSMKEGIAKMRELSETIDKITIDSFKAAAAVILDWIIESEANPSPMMPLRPLVLGGDDITVIIRADLALPFIYLFTKNFEKLSKVLDEPLSLGAGMVAMNKSAPFARAFELAESLLESAKRRTQGIEKGRPSSLDYLSLTEETELDIDDLRARLFSAPDISEVAGENGEAPKKNRVRLTSKPFLIDSDLLEFFRKGMRVNRALSRSLVRSAWTDARAGKDRADLAWTNLRDNLRRGIGGRHDKNRMDEKEFLDIFPGGFFRFAQKGGGAMETLLGDYLELDSLLPSGDLEELFDRMPGRDNA
ncbi:MAG: hypothetical protein K2H64_05810 [Desulfovibrio sp.]|nr:hypothetical protein [Desulfovibrio sp.]